jgi:hypothetical protein
VLWRRQYGSVVSRRVPLRAPPVFSRVIIAWYRRRNECTNQTKGLPPVIRRRIQYQGVFINKDTGRCEARLYFDYT